MFDILDLLWRFFSSQPPGRYFQLHPWHLQAILMVLGLLAAGGLHHLIGFTFRFYRVNSIYAHWLGMPTLVLLVVSVQVLLASYTLMVHADELVRKSLNTEEAAQPAGILGEQLLAAAFGTPDLARAAGAGVTKERITAALRAMPAEALRNSFKEQIVDPGRILLEREMAGRPGADSRVPRSDTAPPVSGGGQGEETGEPPSIVVASKAELTTVVLVQMALRWLADPGREWPRLGPAGEAQAAAKEPVPLPEFVISLLGEIQEGVVLDRLDWEHVAGQRFSSAVMHPMLVKYVTRTAITGAGAVLILNGFYFFGFYRVRRWMQRRRAMLADRTPPSGADAVKSPPH